MNDLLREKLSKAQEQASVPDERSWNTRFLEKALANGLKFLPVIGADCNEFTVHSPTPTTEKPAWGDFPYPSLITLDSYDPKTHRIMPESDNLNQVPVSPQERAKHINDMIKSPQYKVDTNLISDGFHTFKELYDHRIALYIALCKKLDEEDRRPDANPSTVEYQKRNVWRSLKHSNGEVCFGGGWMVLGIGRTPGYQITYHMPQEYWELCNFALVLEQAPEWDGHTPEQALERLKTNFIVNSSPV